MSANFSDQHLGIIFVFAKYEQKEVSISTRRQFIFKIFFLHFTGNLENIAE